MSFCTRVALHIFFIAQPLVKRPYHLMHHCTNLCYTLNEFILTILSA
jgi:hypothetical protein